MSKQLETLLKKAKQNSVATVNGRIVERDFGIEYVGDIEEKWAIEFHNDSLTVELRHWGTVLISIDYLKNTVLTETFYAQSNSDRDALNWFLLQFQTDKFYHVHFYPKRKTAELHDFNNICVKTVTL